MLTVHWHFCLVTMMSLLVGMSVVYRLLFSSTNSNSTARYLLVGWEMRSKTSFTQRSHRIEVVWLNVAGKAATFIYISVSIAFWAKTQPTNYCTHIFFQWIAKQMQRQAIVKGAKFWIINQNTKHHTQWIHQQRAYQWNAYPWLCFLV